MLSLRSRIPGYYLIDILTDVRSRSAGSIDGCLIGFLADAGIGRGATIRACSRYAPAYPATGLIDILADVRSCSAVNLRATGLIDILTDVPAGSPYAVIIGFRRN